ncbi:MAG: PhnX-like: phosphonatase-like hydrolase [Firmicutes bacterium]|nr:PhnX-like: phosphonatase-like hydrolase [Bacillota bacterium]
MEGETVLNILFWDIDGTLVRTSKAGLYAFDEAAIQLWNRSIDFSGIRSAGMTDHSIAAQIVQAASGREPREEEIIALTDRYEELLLSHLAQRTCRVLPSILEILNHLQHQENYKTLLLTGNSRKGAEIKLRHLGLASYFDFAYSAFCDHRSSRTEIARSALTAIDELFPGEKSPNLFVIGDTPHDIQCGQAIGAYTIAVATGTFSVSQLREHSPWWSVEELPQPDEFQSKLEER